MSKLCFSVILIFYCSLSWAGEAAERDAITQRAKQLFADIKELRKSGARPESELKEYLAKLVNISDTKGNSVENAQEILASIEKALVETRKVEVFQSTLTPRFFYSEDGFTKLPLKNEATLKLENYVKVSFEIKQTEYVYVLYEDAGGKCTLLNPEKDYKQFSAGSHEIPLVLEFFPLRDENVGKQKVIVRTSARPLIKPTDCAPSTDSCENCLHTLSFSIAEAKG